MVPPFDFIDQLIREKHWDYLFHCSSIVYPRLFRNFYGFLEVVQDEQGSLTLQATVRGVTFRVNAELIGTIIGTDRVPLKAVLSQTLWFPLLWKSCSCFLILSIELKIEFLTPSGLAYFPHHTVFLQNLYSTIYRLWLNGVIKSTSEKDFFMP
jgi:hypothetical protein